MGTNKVIQICDRCNKETDTLNEVDGEYWCVDCYSGMLEYIEQVKEDFEQRFKDKNGN